MIKAPAGGAPPGAFPALPDKTPASGIRSQSATTAPPAKAEGMKSCPSARSPRIAAKSAPGMIARLSVITALTSRRSRDISPKNSPRQAAMMFSIVRFFIIYALWAVLFQRQLHDPLANS